MRHWSIIGTTAGHCMNRWERLQRGIAGSRESANSVRNLKYVFVPRGRWGGEEWLLIFICTQLELTHTQIYQVKY